LLGRVKMPVWLLGEVVRLVLSTNNLTQLLDRLPNLNLIT
jgi:hypothetical protein